MSGFTGVKQAEFDTMTRKHTEAAGRLEELSQALHRELTTAGLDTTPALRLRELAARVTKQAEDLRRRQKLVHELQRQKVTFGQNPPSSNFVGMPDRLDDAQDLLDGTLAGRAAAKAIDGDEKALKELEKYASRTDDSGFVKAFLGALGPRGVTRLPGSIATLLRDAVNRQDSARTNQLSTSGRNALRMLSSALARGTDPKDPAYQGDDFLRDLVKEGRSEHETQGQRYLGYQAQALVWRAHDGKPPYSAKFMEMVGRDVIVFEREHRKDQWEMSKAYGWTQLPILDLFGALGLGTGPDSKAPVINPPIRKSSMVEDLFHAAKSSREASHTLLNHTPAGWTQPVLDYLLTTRWSTTRYLADYDPINGMLITATTGQDATSKALGGRLLKIVSNGVRSAFGADASGNLTITDRAAFDRYLPLSYPMARAIAARVDEIPGLLRADKERGQEMAYAMVVATASSEGFEAIVRAQTEHMRAALGSEVPPVGLTASNAERFGFKASEVKNFDDNDNGRVDRDDVIRYLEDQAKIGGRSFGFIVEVRRQVLIARGLDDQKADEALTTMAREAIGLLPVPGAKYISNLAAGAFAELASKGYEKLAGLAYDELSRRVAEYASGKMPSLEDVHHTLARNRLAVDRIGEQLLAESLLGKGMLDHLNTKGLSFIVGDPPRVKPFNRMTRTEYRDFIDWSLRAGGTVGLYESFRNTFRTTSDINDLLNLNVPAEAPGEK